MSHLIENAARIKEAHALGTRYFETTILRAIVAGSAEFRDATRDEEAALPG